MLNLSIVMLKTSLILSVIFFVQAADVSITSPHSGDVLRGQVEISGNMNVPNFASAELAFTYAASDSTESWFTIQTFPQPVQNPTLATWDTTSLTDGDYILRLRVTLQDGTLQDVVVSDLKIRNDVPLPTETPTATLPPQLDNSLPIPPTETIQPVTAIPTFPSSTPLPANPAAVTTSSIYGTFAKGGLITLVLFIIFSLLLRLRKN
jgi:hypothetical protein